MCSNFASICQLGATPSNIGGAEWADETQRGTQRHQTRFIGNGLPDFYNIFTHADFSAFSFWRRQ